MADDHVFVPFERPDISIDQEFQNHMSMAVAQASLGKFTGNLWGLAVTTERSTETVDGYLWFAEEPTELDRYEMSEFEFSFTAITGGGVTLRIHRTVMDRGGFASGRTGLRWLYRQRHPSAELPDDVGADELDF